jgi:hypothetical protein
MTHLVFNEPPTRNVLAGFAVIVLDVVIAVR